MIGNTHTGIRAWAFPLFIGFSGASMLTQILAVIISLTPQSNYFQVGSVFPTLTILFAIAALICGTLDAILTNRNSSEAKAPSPAMLPAGIGLLISAVGLLIQGTSTLATVSVVFSLVGALYCILSSIKSLANAACNVFLCFGATISCASLTIYHYFDFTIEMNAPLKLSLQLAALCAMLFFIGEARDRLSKPDSPIYRAITAWTVLSGAVASVPTIFAFLLGKIDRIDYLTCAIALLGITASATLRLLEGKRAPKADPQSDMNI